MNSRHFLSLVASLLLLIFAGAFWYANQNFNNAQLTLKYYQEPNLASNENVEQSELTTIVRDAFSRKNYKRVIELGQNIPPDMPGYWNARLQLGHAYMKKNQPKEAAEAFTEIVNTKQVALMENAAWHRILTHVQAGNESQTIHFLNEMIKQNSSDYVSKARQLKSDIQSFWRKLVFNK